MRLRYSEHALARLNRQIDFLIERNAFAAAEDLSTGVSQFLEQVLLSYPKTGRFIAERGIWETWIPRTKLVLWYVFDERELVVIDVWHTSQDRQAD